jgi:hypothetical protein
MDQVEHLVEAILKLQQKIVDLDIHTIPDTPRYVMDQREATARSIVERIKVLALECKQLSDYSA